MPRTVFCTNISGILNFFFFFLWGEGEAEVFGGKLPSQPPSRLNPGILWYTMVYYDVQCILVAY